MDLAGRGGGGHCGRVFRSAAPPMELTGKLLIAMPGMGDPRFEHSVIFLCSHGDDGAMGLIVNKPTPKVRLSDLLTQLEIEPSTLATDLVVHFGGPVERVRGFVLHSPDYIATKQTLKVSEAFNMTATLDILEDIAAGRGPGQALMMLGYAGWGAGQLESEIGQNGWLTTDATADLVFGSPDQDKWVAALKAMGVDPLMLSADAGRA